MNDKTIAAALGLLLMLTTAAHAGTWQLGNLAESSRSPFIGDRRETSVMPFFNYFDGRFRFEGGRLLYELSADDASQVFVAGQVRARQFYSASMDLDDNLDIEGMDARDPAFELGLGFNKQTTWGRYSLEGSADVSRAHQGYELALSYSYPYQSGRWLVEPGLGLQWQSDNLVDYYHGVRTSEARDDRPAYRGDQAINSLAKLTVGYTINSRLLTIAGMEQVTLDRSIADSPIVSESQVLKLYVGVIYTF